MAPARKPPGKKPVSLGASCFVTQHACKQSRVAEPEAPEACPFKPLTFTQPTKLCLQGIQPSCMRTRDHGISALLGSPGKLLPLDPNCSFTCRHYTFTCTHFTHSLLISAWTTVIEAEVLTVPLHCEKNAMLLPP